MTRRDLVAAIKALPDDEKLELISEVWDALDHSEPMPEWHKDELDRRVTATDAAAFVSWHEAKLRILGSK